MNYLKGVAVLILFSILFLLFFNSISEAAILDANRHKQSRPTVWYSPSVSNYGYTANYDSGRAYWNSHLLVSITKSSTSENSDRYYIGDSSTPGLLGVMIGYSTTGNPTSSNSYWHYTTVYMYDNQMRAQSNYSTSRVNYNAAHEIGHTLKMGHASIVTNSVMPQGFNTRPASLTQFDRGEIDRKWGL